MRAHAARGDARSIDQLNKAPQVPAGLAALAWACFNDLLGEHPVGMGTGPLPWRAIRAWADDRGIAGDDFDDLLAVVQNLDGLWLKAAAAKKPTPPDKKG